jgi:alanyl-tRNA synthetase
VFAELFSFETVSVHLGEEYGAVELNTEAMQSEQLWQAEKRTREIIAENAEVSILFISASEAAKLPLRKPPAREGTIRIIKIGEYDWSACGGTHCIRTSEIGSFVVLGTSKMRGRTLVTYLAGVQLTADYESRRDVTAKLGELFTCSVADLPSNVAKLVDESKFQRKQIDMLFREVIPMRAESKAGEARQVGAYNLYVGSDETEDAKLVSLLAGAIAERISGIAVMMGKSRVIIACGRASCCKAGDIAKAVASATGGRGGGSDTAAQVGSIPSGTIAEVASIVETYLAQH